MKRDMDLVRNILLAVEERDKGSRVFLDLSDLSECSQLLTEHLFLLDEAGLIVGVDCSSNKGRAIGVVQLTWNGHEFVDSVRDPKIWKKTKSTAKDVGGFSFEFLGEIAKGVIKTKLKQHADIDL